MHPREVTDGKTHIILKERMRADLRVYRDAANALEQTPGVPFEKVHKLAEIARVAFEASRDRFNAHVASHKCEVRYVGSARSQN
jgi:hypothetical protein